MIIDNKISKQEKALSNPRKNQRGPAAQKELAGMSDKKKKFPLRWVVGALLVAALEVYTWRNGRSVDDFGNVGPVDTASMLLMLIAGSVVVFGVIFLFTAIQKVLADKRREDAELAAAAAALEQAEQTLEEVEDALEEGVDPETLKDRIDAAQQAVDVAQEAVEDAQDVVEDMLEHFDRGDDDRKEERRGD